MRGYSVTKCICHNRSFEQIKAYAKRNRIDTVEELQERYICSCSCQQCLPYVKRMLKTGETSFEIKSN